MKSLQLTITFIIIGLASIALVNRANAATEFVSIINPDNAAGTDYTSLAAWVGRRNGTLCNKQDILKNFKDVQEYLDLTSQVISYSQERKLDIKKFE